MNYGTKGLKTKLALHGYVYKYNMMPKSPLMLSMGISWIVSLYDIFRESSHKESWLYKKSARGYLIWGMCSLCERKLAVPTSSFHMTYTLISKPHPKDVALD